MVAVTQQCQAVDHWDRVSMQGGMPVDVARTARTNRFDLAVSAREEISASKSGVDALS